MGRTRTVHRCTSCAATSPRWAGRCPTCGAWNSLVEEVQPAARAGAAPERPSTAPVPLPSVAAGAFAPRPTGVGELDRVLGGGLVPGSVTLLGGEPGIGKSTLLLQAAAAAAAGGRRCLVVSAEESPQQVRLRAERLGALHPDVLLLAETDVGAVVAAVEATGAELVVVDSIQTLCDPTLESVTGSVTQVRQCAHRLVQLSKATGVATVLVGHVTKEGSLAGPRVLEHVVDTVLSFEGDRHHALRLLRALKHRFGATGELGLFEMADSGLISVPDASGFFLGDRRPGVAGSVVVPTVEGQRPLLVEVQALVAASGLATPRRSAQGLDPGRLNLVLAVLQQRLGLPFSGADVYAVAVGGVRLTEPGADLGLALALVSALTNRPLPDDLVACGEVGLGGEVRQVAQTGRRLAEAGRLGFRQVIVPASAPAGPTGVRATRVRTLAEAVDVCGLVVTSEHLSAIGGPTGTMGAC